MKMNRLLQTLILAGVLSIGFVGCKEVQEVQNSNTVEITKYADFENHIGDKVTLIGRYENLNVNKRATAEPVYNGRIKIVTSDSIGILLETHDLGLRPEKEIKQYLGKTVIVTGTIGDNCLAWGNGEMASIVAPCIRGIESIVLAE